MSLRITSLLAPEGQEIPNDGKYHIVRFPYDATNESYDPWGMHSPGPVSNWATDDRSGLIHPAADGWGWLTAMLYVERGDYTEVRDRFVRDPLGHPDSTATEDHKPTGGGQYLHKSHEIFVHPDVPLAYMVRFPGAAGPTRLLHAQFKLAIGTDVVSP